MATTTASRQRTAHSMSYFQNMVKDMDDAEKLELVSIIIDSMKPKVATQPMQRYTKEEINAMIDEAEAEIAAGGGTSHEEVMREWDEEIERWEQEDLKLQMAETL